MARYDPRHYYQYDEMTEFLHQVEADYPHLVKLHSLARTRGGREVWLVEITTFETGPSLEKPAYWMDGNTHATELAGSAACLFAIDMVTRSYRTQEDFTFLLDAHALYIVPRISPDGAEYCLTTGDSVRSTTRPYPFPEERWEGLHPGDIDGDGLVLQMRVRDPLGDWKVSEHDPRLLVKRLPDDRRGPFYHVYREGVLEDFDGFRVEVKSSPYGMDFNRNYPFEWQAEPDQRGAGPYPLSEPETRGIAEFITQHPNICGVQTFHTYSAAILRPYSTKPDEDMPEQDLETYKALGQRGTDLTGYPCLSVYHDFRHHKDLIRGGFDDWCFHHRGVFAFTTEIWSIGKAAGLDVSDHIRFLDRRSEEEMLTIVRWHDTEGLDMLHPWRPFEHPQLGHVEIGGWQTLFSWSNPPPHFLPDICEKLTRFCLVHAGAAPRLVMEGFQCEWLSDLPPLRKVTLSVANAGYLPTYVTEHALKRKIVRPIEVELDLPDRAELIIGKKRTELGHLEGISSVVNAGWGDPTYFRGMTEGHRQKMEWLVRGNGVIGVTVTSERAGTLRATAD